MLVGQSIAGLILVLIGVAMKRKNGAISSTKSETRSTTLSGRPSLRKGERNIPRATQVVGLKPQPKRDPSLLPWPGDCVQIVASTPMTVNVRGIRGVIVDKYCADCGTRLAVDSVTIEIAMLLPERQQRPLRFICLESCLKKYDLKSITHLIDLGSTGGNAGEPC